MMGDKSEETGPAIRFRFDPDRFGIREGGQPLQIEYARRAVRALTHWRETIEQIFGEPAAAMEAATQARILPQYPDWSATIEPLALLRDWLGLDYSASPEGASTTLAPPPPGITSERLSITGQIVDPRMQDAVEILRLYLQALQTWVSTFQAGVWVAGVAAIGSMDSDPRARLLQGLKTIAAVFEFDVTLSPDRIREQFRGLLAIDGKTTSGGVTSELASLFSNLGVDAQTGTTAMEEAPTASVFADDPDIFDQWLNGFIGTVQSYRHHQAPGLASSAWQWIEDAYWQQWKWPPNGAVTRQKSPAAVSLLDLIYTTRFGGVPILHWRGGSLSICQWSRILAIEAQRRREVLREPARTGLSNLGFFEDSGSSNRSDKKRPTRQANLPIAMMSPYSESSPAWTWRPDPAVRAFAAMPRALADGDEAAVKFGLAPDAAREAGVLGGSMATIATALRDQSSGVLLHFIETSEGAIAEMTVMTERLPWAPWRRIYFGDGVGWFQPYVSTPPSIGALVDAVRERYPGWLSRSAGGERGFFQLLWREMRLAVLSVRRYLAAAARYIRFVRREVTRLFR